MTETKYIYFRSNRSPWQFWKSILEEQMAEY